MAVMKANICTLATAVLAVAFSVLPTQALALDLIQDADARRSINALKSQIKDLNIRIDNEISQLARRIDSRADDAKVNGLLISLESLRSDLNARVASLNGQIEVLTNDINKAHQKVDKLSNDLANAQRREKDLYADIEQRLSKLEPRRQTIDGVEHDITQAEQKSFDEANALYRKKDFSAATRAFLNFLQRFPDSGYAAQAYFFLGGSYFGSGDCKNAMPAWQTVFNRFEMSPRASEAMLNLSICQDELNDHVGSRDTLEALVKKYPGSAAASKAKSRLGTLK